MFDLTRRPYACMLPLEGGLNVSEYSSAAIRASSAHGDKAMYRKIGFCRGFMSFQYVTSIFSIFQLQIDVPVVRRALEMCSYVHHIFIAQWLQVC